MSENKSGYLAAFVLKLLSQVGVRSWREQQSSDVFPGKKPLNELMNSGCWRRLTHSAFLRAGHAEPPFLVSLWRASVMRVRFKQLSLMLKPTTSKVISALALLNKLFSRKFHNTILTISFTIVVPPNIGSGQTRKEKFYLIIYKNTERNIWENIYFSIWWKNLLLKLEKH